MFLLKYRELDDLYEKRVKVIINTELAGIFNLIYNN